MICKYCGKKIPDDASFCPFCGEKTESHLRREDRHEDKDNYEYEEPKGKRRIKALLSIIAAALLVIAVFIVIFVVARPFLGEDFADETVQTDEEADEDSGSTVTMYISAEDGLLRYGPAQDSEAIHVLINGQEVQAGKTNNGWAYVTADGVPGWCPEEYLSAEPVETEQEGSVSVPDEDKGKLVEPSIQIESGYHWVVNTDGGLNLRCGPGQEYDIMMVVPDKTELAEEGRDGNWLFIKYDGQYGWLNMEYLAPAEAAQ